MKFEKHLRIFDNRSEFYHDQSNYTAYLEGPISIDAKKRHKKIKDGFDKGFLDEVIISLKAGKSAVNYALISEVAKNSVIGLTQSVTSEVGRAIIGLSVMQLAIKSIEPSQSVRLHKASGTSGSFSWAEGISMRTLDKQYVTPSLRRHNLVKLNADGFMMTRSLAENYPYTSLYKAQIRGAREEWISLVDEIEAGNTEPIDTLRFFVSLLINSAEDFNVISQEVTHLLKLKIDHFKNRETTQKFIYDHIKNSDYAARLFEVSLHALAQSLIEKNPLSDVELKPLSQMRSANKKHGNIGDIEFLDNGQIIESFDAKYGKDYLREELEEAAEKSQLHSFVKSIAFVTNESIVISKEIDKRLVELKDICGIDFKILSFNEWTSFIYKRAANGIGDSVERELSARWITIYLMSLTQQNRECAPIDEPCGEWVKSLLVGLKKI